jgi:hypothetical protein
MTRAEKIEMCAKALTTGAVFADGHLEVDLTIMTALIQALALPDDQPAAGSDVWDQARVAEIRKLLGRIDVLEDVVRNLLAGISGLDLALNHPDGHRAVEAARAALKAKS